jgi:Transposase/Protein of unknown function (DUF1153)
MWPWRRPAYWKPVWHILDDGEFALVLANAAHVKNVLGRKTDRNDAMCLAEVLAHGLIRASFVPDTQTQEMRNLLRTRKQFPILLDARQPPLNRATQAGCSRYMLPVDELLSWQSSLDQHGLAGLRTTRMLAAADGACVGCVVRSASGPAAGAPAGRGIDAADGKATLYTVIAARSSRWEE